MSKKLVIVDTDCGIDDAQAILMALAAPGVQVLALTCVFGNADVNNVCQNVLRVLSVCGKEEVPVFRGCRGPLVGADCPLSDHFGSDGLGDVFKDKDPQWEQKIQKEHAVSAMIRLVSERPNQVSLVALGPLTNLAMALRLDPEFPKKLMDLYVMGGNMEGKGNVSLCAEFNFRMDPESAHVVLEEFLCSTYIATWEFAARNKLSWDFFDTLMSQDSAAARFMKTVTSQCWAYSRDSLRNKKDVFFGPGFVSYDSYAVAAFIDPGLITASQHCPVRVELQGTIGRGMMVLDLTDQLKKAHQVFVFEKCDVEKFGQLMMSSFRQL